MPLDRLLVETDCPYMTPSPSAAGGATRRSFPHRRAARRDQGISAQELLDITCQNARSVYQLD
ncbi:MAG: TatD family hydrolase [Anaerotruncus massiliensis (ex Togo et al. 2019)]